VCRPIHPPLGHFASILSLTTGLVQGGRVLFLGCTNLLQLGLDFLELLRQAVEDTILLDNFEDGGVSFLFDCRQLHHHPRADHTRSCNQYHKSSLDKKQVLRWARTKEPSDLPSRSCDNLELEL
jgi:hypothetical protein